MPKPICVIYYNPEIAGDRLIKHSEINEGMKKQMPDYHVFCIPQFGLGEEGSEPVNFKVFYEKDFTDIQYLELKKLIEESLPNYNHNDDLTGVI